MHSRTILGLRYLFTVGMLAFACAGLAWAFLWPHDHGVRLSDTEEIAWQYSGFSTSLVDGLLSHSASLGRKGHHRQAGLAIWQAAAADDATARQTDELGLLAFHISQSGWEHMVYLEFVIAGDAANGAKFRDLIRYWPHYVERVGPPKSREVHRSAEMLMEKANPAGISHDRVPFYKPTYAQYFRFYRLAIKSLFDRAAALARNGMHAQAGMVYWQAAAMRVAVERQFRKMGFPLAAIGIKRDPIFLAKRQFDMAGQGLPGDFESLMKLWPK